ncbi:Glutamate receptor U1-like 4 [Homarus americanus]|uniref:Glutamate receptor U1-like 4 n=1 Tax=Homarus americanus TaxID=6706 RepID=A0A8J5MM72_HOMAM|nr:Glutamate receptor U1-like 4 [Homarus americanus]
MSLAALAKVPGSMESTRSKTEVWLIGQHITEITGAQLPSRGDVLRLFFHGHNEHKKTVNDSASEVAASVISFWNKARIPTITEKSIGRKVVDLFLMWKGLKKNCTRTTDTQRKKEETFCDELEDLFDVAHPKAMQLLTIKEDRAFLAAQREKGRRGVMAGVDKKIACSIKRREESKSKQSLQQNQASSALEYDELGSSSETESQSSSSSSTSSLTISPVVSSSNRKRATLKVITPELSSTLDRTGISHRSALRIWIPWTSLKEMKDGSYKIGGPMDSYWGIKLPNGTWNGMVGMVHRNEVEFALGPFTVTPQREGAIDFTLAVHSDNQAIFMVRPGLQNDITGFLKPFTLEVKLRVVEKRRVR